MIQAVFFLEERVDREYNISRAQHNISAQHWRIRSKNKSAVRFTSNPF